MLKEVSVSALAWDKVQNNNPKPYSKVAADKAFKTTRNFFYFSSCSIIMLSKPSSTQKPCQQRVGTFPMEPRASKSRDTDQSLKSPTVRHVILKMIHRSSGHSGHKSTTRAPLRVCMGCARVCWAIWSCWWPGDGQWRHYRDSPATRPRFPDRCQCCPAQRADRSRISSLTLRAVTLHIFCTCEWKPVVGNKKVFNFYQTLCW